MAILITCASCKTEFEGRKNKRYCSIECRRQAEMVERQKSKERRYQAIYDAMTAEEKSEHDRSMAWIADLPTWNEMERRVGVGASLEVPAS